MRRRLALLALAPAALLGLGALTLGALLLLAVALGLARLALRPARRKPKRKTFERGRAEGLARRPMSADEALHALARAGIGRVGEVRQAADGSLVLALRPARSKGCDHARGVLSGLFESAWACDVRVDHLRCGGRRGPCEFVVTRARRVSGAGPRAGGASTPGW